MRAREFIFESEEQIKLYLILMGTDVDYLSIESDRVKGLPIVDRQERINELSVIDSKLSNAICSNIWEVNFKGDPDRAKVHTQITALLLSNEDYISTI